MIFQAEFFPLAFGLGWMEMTVILVVALLLFGKRLPEVMRSAGKSFVEFKKGLRGIENEIEDATSKAEKKKTSSQDRQKEVGPAAGASSSAVEDYVSPGDQ